MKFITLFLCLYVLLGCNKGSDVSLLQNPDIHWSMSAKDIKNKFEINENSTHFEYTGKIPLTKSHHERVQFWIDRTKARGLSSPYDVVIDFVKIKGVSTLDPKDLEFATSQIGKPKWVKKCPTHFNQAAQFSYWETPQHEKILLEEPEANSEYTNEYTWYILGPLSTSDDAKIVLENIQRCQQK